MDITLNIGPSADFHATGQLGPFQLDIANQPYVTPPPGDPLNTPTGAHLEVSVGLSTHNAVVGSPETYKYRPQDPNDVTATRMAITRMQLVADATINLPSTLSILGDADFPQVRATFFIQIKDTFDLTKEGAKNTLNIPKALEIRNIEVNIGDFLYKTLKPAINVLGIPLKPLGFLLNRDTTHGQSLGLYYQEIPILSHLPKLGPVQVGGSINEIVHNIADKVPELKPLPIVIDVLADVVTIVNTLSGAHNLNEAWVDLGDESIGLTSEGGADKNAMKQTRKPGASKSHPDGEDPAQQARDAGDAAGRNGDANSKKATDETFKEPKMVDDGNGNMVPVGLTFPIVQNPLTVVNLLIGNYANVDFVRFDMPPLVPSYDFDLTLPYLSDVIGGLPSGVRDVLGKIINVIPVQVTAGLGFHFHPLLNFGGGYDASGIAKFVQTHDASDFIEGFYIKSGEVLGVDASVSVHAGVKVTNPFSFIPGTPDEVFKAWADGSLSGNLVLTINDPNADGKLRLRELETLLGYKNSNVLQNLGDIGHDIFNDVLSGDIGDLLHKIGRVVSVKGKLNWTLDAGYRFLGDDSNGNSFQGGGTIFDFDTASRDEGGIGKVGQSGQGVNENTNQPTVKVDPLLASVGKDGKLWLNVGAKAAARTFGDVSDANEVMIVAGKGGGAYDVTMNGLTVRYTGVNAICALGGGGNDTITITGVDVPVTLTGGTGTSHFTVTSSGPVVLTGGGGNDYLASLGGGPAAVTGGSGNDTVAGGSGANLLDTGDGNDTIYTGLGNSTVSGGAGDDTIYAQHGTSLIDGGSGSNTLAFDDSGDPITPNGNTADTSNVVNRNNPVTFNSAQATYRNIQALRYKLGSGTDSLSVNATPGIPVAIETGSGSDTVVVAKMTDPVTVTAGAKTGTASDVIRVGDGLLGGIRAALIVDGTGTAKLVVDAHLDTQPRTASLLKNTVTGLGIPGSLTFRNLGSAEVDLGSGGDVFTVEDTVNFPSLIRGGGGANTYYVKGLVKGVNADVTLEGNASDRAFLTAYGTPSPDPAAPGVTVKNVGRVRLDNSGSRAGDAVTWTLVGGKFRVGDENTGNVLLQTTNVANTDVVLGAADDSVTVATLGNATTVSAGGGTNAFRVGANELIDQQLRPVGGVASNLSLTGGSPNDTLTVDNTADAAQRDNGVLARPPGERGRLTGLGMPNNVAVDYDVAGPVRILLGSGGGTFTVADTVNPTTVKTSGGVNTVRVLDNHAAGAGFGVDLGATVGDTVAVVNSSTPLSLTGSNQSYLVIDRSAETTNLTGSLTDGTPAGVRAVVSGLGLGGGVTFQNFWDVKVLLGAGNDTLTLDTTLARTTGTTPTAVTVTVSGGPGDDTFLPRRVGQGAGALTTVTGDSGVDQVTVLYGSAYPPTSGVTLGDHFSFTAERLLVDNAASGRGVAWRATDDELFADGTRLLRSLSGVYEVRVLGAAAGAPAPVNTLTVDAPSNASVDATMSLDKVQLIQGQKVLSFDAALHDAALNFQESPTAGAQTVTTSDNQFVYAKGFDNGFLNVFRRDPTTNQLRLVQILTNIGSAGGAVVNGQQMVISADGRFLYLLVGVSGTNNDAVTVLARDAATGKLAPVQTVPFTGKTHSGFVGIPTRSLALRGGGQLYATNGNVALFNRDAATGQLTFVRAVLDDLSPDFPVGVEGLHLVLSPDGNSAYRARLADPAVDQFGMVIANTYTNLFVDKYAIDASGGMTRVASVVAFSGPRLTRVSDRGLEVSPDGRFLYVRGQKLVGPDVAHLTNQEDFYVLRTDTLASVQTVNLVPGLTSQVPSTEFAVAAGPDYRVGGQPHGQLFAGPNWVFDRNVATGQIALQQRVTLVGLGWTTIDASAPNADGTSYEVYGNEQSNYATFRWDGTQGVAGALNRVTQRYDFSPQGLQSTATYAPANGGDTTFAVSPGDDRFLALRDNDNTVINVQIAGALDDNFDLEGMSALAVNGNGNVVLVSAQTDTVLYAFQSSGRLTRAGLKQFAAGARSVVAVPNSGTFYVGGPGGITYVPSQALNGAVTPVPAESALAFDGGGAFLYAASGANGRLTVLARNAASGALTAVQTLQNGVNGVNGLGGVSGVQVSADGLNVYAVSKIDSSLVVFRRNVTDGTLTPVQVLQNGRRGAGGLAGAVAVAVAADGQFVYVAARDEDAVSIYSRNPTTGRLTLMQVLRNGSAGVQGLHQPNSLALSPADPVTKFQARVTVGTSSGLGGQSGGFVVLDRIPGVLPPAERLVSYTGMAALTLNALNGDATVRVDRPDAPTLTVNTDLGKDAISLLNAAALSTTINTGADGDTIDLRSNVANARVAVNAGAGDDNVSLVRAGAGQNTTINGNDGNDTFRVDGYQIDPTAVTTIHGDNPTVLPGDTLLFNPARLGFSPNPFSQNAGTLRAGTKGVVTYDTMEQVRVISPPIPNAGGPYTISEGQDLTLAGSADGVGVPVTSYAWDLDGDGVFGDAVGATPTLTWNDLQSLGIVNDGVYQIALQAASANGSGTALTTLIVLNTPPTITLTGGNPNVGVPYTLGLAATDPAIDRVVGWRVAWGDGAVDDLGSEANAATHTYQNPGPYVITATVTQDDPNDGPTSATKAVTAVASVSAGGPYRIAQGDDLVLQATAPGTPTDVRWSLLVGSTTTALGTGAALTVPWSRLLALGAARGSYSVTSQIFYKGVLYASPSAALTVADTAPTLTLTGAASVDQRATFTLNLSASDPGNEPVTGWTITWGDGVVTPVSGNPSSVTHVFARAGSYTVSATATQPVGTFAAGNTLTVAVNRVAPALTYVADCAVVFDPLNPSDGHCYVDQYKPVTLTLNGPPAGDVLLTAWTVAWGDGTADTLPGNAATVSHAYAKLGDYTPLVQGIDPFGAYVATGTPPYPITVRFVPRAAPTLTLTGAASVNEGAVYALGLSAVGGANSDPIGSWIIFWGDGSNDTVSGAIASATHVYASGPATYTIKAIAKGADATYFATPKLVLVNHLAPTVSISGPSATDEGSVYTLGLSATGLAGSNVIRDWVINWGDGTVETVAFNPAQASHVYADGPNTYTISASADDGVALRPATNTLTVTVNNVPPALTLGGPDTVFLGAPLKLDLRSSDPGQDTIRYWTITWGDGQVQRVDGNPSRVPHTYASAGRYTVSATAADEDGTFAGRNTLTVTVGANAAPTVCILGAPATTLEGTAVHLTSQVFGTGGYSYLWEVRRVNDGTFNGAGTNERDPLFATGTTADFTFTPDDNGVYLVRLTVKDGQGRAGADAVSVAAANVAPTATLTNTGPVAPGAGVVVRFVNPSDPSSRDTAAGFQYAFDAGTAGAFTGTGNLFGTQSFTTLIFAKAGTYTVIGRIYDKDLGVTEYQTTVVVGLVPTGDAGSPYAISEGDGLTLDASASTSPNGRIVDYSWDVNGDGVFGDAAGVRPTLSRATLQALGLDDGLVPNSLSTFHARVKVTDDKGFSAVSAAIDLVLSNAAPTATFGNGGRVVAGNPGQVSFTGAQDPSNADNRAGFRYSYDFDNNGTFEIVNSPSPTATVPASYLAVPGGHVIHGRVADKDGGAADYRTTLSVTAPAPKVVSFQVLYGNGKSYDLIGSSRVHLPWRITGVRAVFSNGVLGSAESLIRTDGALPIASFAGSGTATLTWTFATAIDLASVAAQLVSGGPNGIRDASGQALDGNGDGTAGDNYVRGFKVLYGDFNDDGVVSIADAVAVRNLIGRASDPNYRFADVNGDGVVDNTDVDIVRNRIGTRL